MRKRRALLWNRLFRNTNFRSLLFIFKSKFLRIVHATEKSNDKRSLVEKKMIGKYAINGIRKYELD